MRVVRAKQVVKVKVESVRELIKSVRLKPKRELKVKEIAIPVQSRD